MTDLNRYNAWMTVKAGEWEAKCTRCGACCGALDDPCENLHKNADGNFFVRSMTGALANGTPSLGKNLPVFQSAKKLPKGIPVQGMSIVATSKSTNETYQWYFLSKLMGGHLI